LFLATYQDVEPEWKYDIRSVGWFAGPDFGSAWNIPERASLPLELRLHADAESAGTSGRRLSLELLPCAFCHANRKDRELHRPERTRVEGRYREQVLSDNVRISCNQWHGRHEGNRVGSGNEPDHAKPVVQRLRELGQEQSQLQIRIGIPHGRLSAGC